MLEKMKKTSYAIVEKLESNLFRKQVASGLNENIEKLKITGIRLVYLIEVPIPGLNRESQDNDAWLVGTEKCQVQSVYPIARSKILRSPQNVRKDVQKSRQRFNSRTQNNRANTDLSHGDGFDYNMYSNIAPQRLQQIPSTSQHSQFSAAPPTDVQPQASELQQDQNAHINIMNDKRLGVMSHQELPKSHLYEALKFIGLNYKQNYGAPPDERQPIVPRPIDIVNNVQQGIHAKRQKKSLIVSKSQKAGGSEFIKRQEIYAKLQQK